MNFICTLTVTVLTALIICLPADDAQAVCTGQFAPGQVCANNTAALAPPGPTSNLVLGIPGTTLGSLDMSGNTSGSVHIVPQAAAGSPTIKWPTTTGTLASSATTPIILDPITGILTCPTCLTTTGSFANPTASVGLATVNGSATTALRSDAAPPLSSSVQSALTGTNTYLLIGTGSFGFSSEQFATLAQGGLGGSQAAATAGQVPVAGGGGTPYVPTSASTWFDSVCSSTVGQIWNRATGAWGCNFLGYYKPEWFGATGTADDYAVIQATINAAQAATPARIYFECKEYKSSDEPTVTVSNISIEGCPSTGTILTITNTAKGGFQFKGPTPGGTGTYGFIYNNSISNFYQRHTSAPTGNGIGLNLYYTQLMKVTNVQNESFKTGVSFQRATNGIYYNLQANTNFNTANVVAYDWNGTSASTNPADFGGNASSICTNCWGNIVAANASNSNIGMNFHGDYVSDLDIITPQITGGLSAYVLDYSATTSLSGGSGDVIFTNPKAEQWTARGWDIKTMPALAALTIQGGWSLPATGSSGNVFELTNTNNVQIKNHQCQNIANSGAVCIVTSGTNTNLDLDLGTISNFPTPISLSGISSSKIKAVISNAATAVGPPATWAAGAMVTVSGTSVRNTFDVSMSGYATYGYNVGAAATSNKISGSIDPTHITTPVADAAAAGSNQYGTDNIGFTNFGFNWASASGTQGGLVWFPTANTLGNTGALTQYGVIYGGGTGAPTTTAAGTTGQYLSGVTAGAPVWASLASAAVTTFSAGTTGFTPNSATAGAVTLAGTLGLANGGTNASLTANNGGVVYSSASALGILSGTATANLPLLSGSSITPSWASIAYPTSATQYGIPYFSTTTAMATTAAGTSTQVLHGNNAGAPTWSQVSLTADVTGTLPAANGGTGNTGGAWSGSWNPTITCVAGSVTSYTTQSGRYEQIGKTVHFSVYVVINASTCTFVNTISMPVAATSQPMVDVFLVRETGATGIAYQATISSTGTAAAIVDLNNGQTAPGGTGKAYAFNGVYEAN